MLAIGFGSAARGSGLRALLSLQQPFEPALEHLLRGLAAEAGRTVAARPSRAIARGSIATASRTAVLATPSRRRLPGAIIASLSIPWGFTKGDDDLGGYHLVWPRDLVETAGGLLAAGAIASAQARAGLSAAPSRRRTATGRRIPGSTAGPIGAASRSTRRGFPILLYDMLLRAGAIEPRGPRALYRR